jgi:tetratricopeptide (TPR) repeat protein
MLSNMTLEESRRVLNLREGTSLEESRRHFEAQHEEIQAKLKRAPTPSLKEKYGRRMTELEAAWEVVEKAEVSETAANFPMLEREPEKSDSEPFQFSEGSRDSTVSVSSPTREKPVAPPSKPRPNQKVQWAMLAGALIIALLAAFAVIRSNFSRDQPEWAVAAIADNTEAIRLKPDDEQAFFKRGDAYRTLEQYDKAISDFTEAIRLKPDDEQAFFERAMAYQALKQYDKAIADYTEVIRLQPDFMLAFNFRGDIYLDYLKQYDKAISDYTEAIRLKPDNEVAFFSRAMAYMDLARYHNAIDDFSECIRRQPRYPLYYNQRADCYDSLGDRQKAEEDRAKAKELSPWLNARSGS